DVKRRPNVLLEFTQPDVAVVLDGRVENLHGHGGRAGEMIAKTQPCAFADRSGRFDWKTHKLPRSLFPRHAASRAPIRSSRRALNEVKITGPIFLFGAGVESGQKNHASGKRLELRRKGGIIREKDHVIDEELAARRLLGPAGEKLEVVHPFAFSKWLGAAAVARGVARE